MRSSIFSVVAQRQFPLVVTVQNTIEILLLQYIDKVVDVGCAGSANSSGSVVEETAELPQLQLVEL